MANQMDYRDESHGFDGNHRDEVGWVPILDDRNYPGAQTHAGRGPRNYQRPDERIREDVNEELTRHPGIDASDVDVSVNNGEVTLSGTVDSRNAKRMAEDAADSCAGVKDVHNQLRVEQQGSSPQT